MKRRIRTLVYSSLIFLMILSMLTTECLIVNADNSEQVQSTGELKKLNIELVIDGSGSLVNGDTPTDPSGLRYDAINLFLALLANKGNEVGAIVFDDNSEKYIFNADVASVEGKQAKMNLADKIKKAGTGVDTDIGSALKTAVEALKKHQADNDNASAVILMSDGRTDLGGDKKKTEASLANKETAITEAQDAGIPVYTLCLNASPVADPSELKEIADRTSGTAIEVNKPEDLAGAFEEFYKLIFAAASGERIDGVFPDTGELNYNISVPKYGAEEVNIIVASDGVQGISVKSPTKTLTDQEIKDSTMQGGNYQVVKLADPEAGNWNVSLKGTKGSNMTINVVYNVDTVTKISADSESGEYKAGDTATITANLYQNNEALTDTSITDDYTAELTITNQKTQESQTVGMTPDKQGGFTYSFKPTDYAAYQLTANLKCNSLSLESNSLQLSFGNSAPAVKISPKDKEATIKVVALAPFIGKSKSVDLTKFFGDEQDKKLIYDIIASQLVDKTASIKGDNLVVQTLKSKSGDVVVSATDSQGATSQTTIHFKVTNLTIPLAVLILGLVIIGIVVFLSWKRITDPVYQGVVEVTNMATGVSFPHGTFRGKLKLSQLHVGQCGLNPNTCYLVAQRGSGLSFTSKQPFYVDGMEMHSMMLQLDDNYIYADKEQTVGIIINNQPII